MFDQLSPLGGNIDAIFFCPHGPRQGCECRKPKPGLLKAISSRLHISLNDVPLVGDNISDIKAAQAVNAKPILVRTGKGQKLIDENKVPDNVPVYSNLAAVADALITSN